MQLRRRVKKDCPNLQENKMGNLEFAAVTYQAVRNRIRSEDPIDEQTLSDTVEGLTDLNEILAAVARSALADEALADGLRGRINEMQERLDRFQDRASKRRDPVRCGWSLI